MSKEILVVFACIVKRWFAELKPVNKCKYCSEYREAVILFIFIFYFHTHSTPRTEAKFVQGMFSLIFLVADMLCENYANYALKFNFMLSD